jgi:hypothetical protein
VVAGDPDAMRGRVGHMLGGRVTEADLDAARDPATFGLSWPPLAGRCAATGPSPLSLRARGGLP